MEKHSNLIKARHKRIKNTHRHILCLYGEDEKLLRITALHLNITVSHLIRLALHLFLPNIENLKTPWNHMFYYGIKICRYLDVSRLNKLKFPYLEHWFYAKWPPEMWWGAPYPALPLPWTP